MAMLGRLVRIKAQMNAERNLCQPLGAQFQIRRGVIDRIAANNNEHPHPTAVNVSDQFPELVDLQFVRIRRKRLDVRDSLANISQSGVHRVSERVDHRRLIIARNDKGSAFERHQVFRQLGDPPRVFCIS